MISRQKWQSLTFSRRQGIIDVHVGAPENIIIIIKHVVFMISYRYNRCMQFL